jgi:hypothetical protein
MAYKDLRDFVPELVAQTDEGLIVQVEKLGGGTLGYAYTGAWRYIVSDAVGRELGRGQDFETGMPHTHAEVASMIAEFF